MYISDTDKNKASYARASRIYLAVSLFCALFAAVYEMFSHGVYSFYMLFAFAFPLIGGSLVFGILSFLNIKNPRSRLAGKLYNSGIAALTVGSIVKGILDIYGTTNKLVGIYRHLGVLLSCFGIALFFFNARRKKQNF